MLQIKFFTSRLPEYYTDRGQKYTEKRKANMRDKKFLSVRETSERLGLPEKKVRNLIRTGKLPSTRVGYNLIVNARDVAKLAAKS
jgi:excisionase family DNA binding protein